MGFFPQRFKQFLIAQLAAFCLISSTAFSQEATNTKETVHVGVSPATSTAGIFIALEKGYFAEEGLNVELQVFSASSAPMMPLLAKGELDVGGGNVTAGLFNAKESNLDIRIVADKGSVRKNADYIKLLVRADHIKSGRYKTFKDLKGMKASFTALGGTSQEAAFARFLKKGGLTPKDVEFVKLSYADANKALESKSIDATIQVEPFVTVATKSGIAEAVSGVYAVHPGQQSAVLFYSPEFAKNKSSVAVKFMKAYIRGCRDHNKAFLGKKIDSDFDAIVKILTKWTTVKDEAQYKEMTPSGLNDDGYVNLATLKEDVSYFISQGYLEKNTNWESMVDNSFVKQSLKELDSKKKKKSKK